MFMGLAVSPDQRRLYVTCEGRQEVLAIDVPSRKVLHAIRINQAGSHMLVVSPDGARAYVTNFWHGTVTVLDLNARRIVAHIATGSGTEGIGISPDGRYIYTSSVYINKIVKIDTSSLQVVGRRVMENCLGAVRVLPTPGDGRVSSSTVPTMAGAGQYRRRAAEPQTRTCRSSSHGWIGRRDRMRRPHRERRLQLVLGWPRVLPRSTHHWPTTCRNWRRSNHKAPLWSACI